MKQDDIDQIVVNLGNIKSKVTVLKRKDFEQEQRNQLAEEIGSLCDEIGELVDKSLKLIS